MCHTGGCSNILLTLLTNFSVETTDKLIQIHLLTPTTQPMCNTGGCGYFSDDGK